MTVTQPTAANVAFRASGGTNLNSTSPSLTIPASVQAGDVMVLFSTVNRTDTTVTGPAGWTLVNSVSDATAGVQSHLWTRTATATDAGTTVRTTNGLIAKTALQVAAYSSASGISAQAVSLDAINRAERTTPLVPVATAGSALVSYWADKSTDTTTWTVPAAAALRNLSVGTSSGHITAALADTGSLVAGTGRRAHRDRQLRQPAGRGLVGRHRTVGLRWVTTTPLPRRDPSRRRNLIIAAALLAVAVAVAAALVLFGGDDEPSATDDDRDTSSTTAAAAARTATTPRPRRPIGTRPPTTPPTVLATAAPRSPSRSERSQGPARSRSARRSSCGSASTGRSPSSSS